VRFPFFFGTEVETDQSHVPSSTKQRKNLVGSLVAKRQKKKEKIYWNIGAANLTKSN